MTEEEALREPTSAELQQAARLLALLERRGENGGPRFSEEDVRHFLPLVFLSVVSRTDRRTELPDAVMRLLGLFAKEAGIESDASPEAARAAVERYYAAHPVNPELLQAFQAFARDEQVLGGGGGDPGFAAFLGEHKHARPLSQRERPEGTVPGGPLARLAKLKRDDD